MRGKKITQFSLSFFDIPLNYLMMMITIFKLRITTEIKYQQEMNFFWIIITAQIIMNNKLIERRRRFNENKIIKILFFHFSFAFHFFSFLVDQRIRFFCFFLLCLNFKH
jgi:hypothetical protein